MLLQAAERQAETVAFGDVDREACVAAEAEELGNAVAEAEEVADAVADAVQVAVALAELEAL